MDLGLGGRVAIVTGASRGIGLAIVRALAASDVRVIAGSLKTSSELDELARDGQVRIAELDLSQPDAPGRLIALAGDQIDILVNNVGSAPARTGGFLSITDEDWQATLNLNPLAAVRDAPARPPPGAPPPRPRGGPARRAGRGRGRARQHLLGQRPAARPRRARLQ